MENEQKREILETLAKVFKIRDEREAHDHSEITHGRSHQTDKYVDDCMVITDPKLGKL